MVNKLRNSIAVSTLLMVALLGSTAQAGWGRYRITTYYGTPSVPAYYGPTVVVGSAFRPVVVAPAPVVVAPAPVITNYAPAVVVPAPVPVVRATYYAPRRAVFYRPAPAYYYQGYAPGAVILP